MINLRSEITRGLKWQVITILGRQVLGFLIFTTLARLLDPAAFGLVALLGLYNYFASMLADVGLSVAIVQRAKLDSSYLNTAFWFNLALNTLFFFATVLLAYPVARLLGEPHLAPLLGVSSLGLLIGSSTNVQEWLFFKAMDFRRLAIRTLIANGAGGCLGIWLAFGGNGVWSLVWQQLMTTTTASILMWLSSSYRPALIFSPKHLSELLNVGIPAFTNSLISFFTSRFDQFIIGRFAGAEALGLYVVAGKVPELAKTATQQPMSDVLLPTMARLQEDHKKMREAIYKGIELNAIVVFAVFGGLALVAPDAVLMLFGAKWANAAPLTSLLAIYALINALQVFFYPTLLASGVTRKYVALSMCHSAGVLVACLTGIRFGVPYLIGGMILVSAILMVPSIVLLRDRIGLSSRLYVKQLIVPFFASIVMAVAVGSTAFLLSKNFPLWLRLPVHVLVGAVSYMSVIVYLNPAAVRNALTMLRSAAK